ncbi:MAG: transglutaminaseTgpA domain-containing protein [Puniceicoccaceae bacterium]
MQTAVVSSRSSLETLDLGRMRWIVGNVLAITSLFAIQILEILDPLIWIGIMAVAVGVTLKPRLILALPASFSKVAAPFLLIVSGLDFVTSGRDFLPPLVRLISLLTVLRVAQVRSQREDLQLALLCLFLVVVAGVFTLSLQFAVQLIILAPLSIGFLFVSNLMAAEEEDSNFDCRWPDFRWHLFLIKLWRYFDLRVLGYGVVLMAMLLGMSVLIFVTMPRYKWAQSLPFFQTRGSPQTGFNSTVTLGDVTNIVENDGVAFRVDLPSEDSLPAEQYWRMMALDRYDAGTFEHSDVASRARPSSYAESNLISVGDILRTGRRRTENAEPWVFYYEGGISRYLPLPGGLSEIRFQQSQRLELNGAYFTAALNETLNNLLFFQARGVSPSDRAPADAADVRAFEAFSKPIWIDPADRTGLRNLAYPETTLAMNLWGDDRLVLERLVDELSVGEASTAEERARQFLAYLVSTHAYTLSPPAASKRGDPVVYWLASKNPGHCEYFAASLILLCRTAGIPARMVVGFRGGKWNDYERYFVVRNRNAHAWVEIYSEGEWVRLDALGTENPLAGGGSSEGISGGVEFERGISAWVDSLRVLWYRRVIDFDDTDQEALAEQVTGWWETVGGTVKAGWNNLREKARALKEKVSGLPHLDWILFGVIVLGSGLFLLLLRFGAKVLPHLRFGEDRGKLLRLSRERQRAGEWIQMLPSLAEETLPPGEITRLRESLLRIRYGRETPVAEARVLFGELRQLWKNNRRESAA